MLTAPVHKDIGEYTEKVVGKLSARTLTCVAGGILSSFAAAAGSYFLLGIQVSDAALPVMAASMPFWLLGFWRPRGLKAEEYVPMRLDHMLFDGKLAYEAGCDPRPIAGERTEARTDRRAGRAARRKGAERRAPSRGNQGQEG